MIQCAWESCRLWADGNSLCCSTHNDRLPALFCVVWGRAVAAHRSGKMKGEHFKELRQAIGRAVLGYSTVVLGLEEALEAILEMEVL